MSRLGKKAAAPYLVALLIVAAGVVTTGLTSEWTAVGGWIVAAVWITIAYLHHRRADRAMTSYVLAVGRNAGEYARGVRDGYRLAGMTTTTTTTRED